MLEVRCPACGASMDVAGAGPEMVVECPECGHEMSLRSAPVSVTNGGHGTLRHTRYVVRRKILNFLGVAFHIYDPAGEVVAYSKLKAFKLKEDIRLYTGEDMRTEVLSIRARQVLDLGATYDVVDSLTGARIGALRRKVFRSMLRDMWLILDSADAEIGSIEEDSLPLALVRRIAMNLVPQKFNVMVYGQRVCELKQNFNPLVSKIRLDFSMDRQAMLDRRLGIAAAILLCAIEGRRR